MPEEEANNRYIKTEGGAYFEGDAITEGGTLIGRDQVVHGDIVGIKVVHPDARPPIYYDVPSLIPPFLGREDLITELTKSLLSREILALSAEGLPGVGKTALAVALAHHADVLDRFKDGVLWAGLGPKADVVQILGGWASALGEDISHITKATDRSAAVRNAIGLRHIMLIIDDAWELEAARLLRCGGPNCCHLLTTRDQWIAQEFASTDQAINVPVLKEEPSHELLRKLAPRAWVADPEAAQTLADSVDGLPLALKVLGAYLNAPGHGLSVRSQAKAVVNITQDTKAHLQLATERLGKKLGTREPLEETIGLSLKALPEDAVAAFHSLGAFAPKPEQFSLEAAIAVAEVKETVLELLVSRNLVEFDAENETLTLHQTLANIARAGMGELDAERHRRYYLEYVNLDRDDWQHIEAAYGQIKWGWQSNLMDDSVLDFYWALRTYLRLRGVWDDYDTLAHRGLDEAQARGVQEAIGTLYNEIGLMYRKTGLPQDALGAYGKALSFHEEVGDRAEIATTLNNIGMVYYATDQPEQALEYLQQALPIREEAGDRAGMASTLNNIGAVYHDTGQFNQALEYYQQALPISEEVRDRAGIASTLTNVGSVYRATGQLDRALKYYQQALPIFEEVGDRAGMATTLNHIGMVCRASRQPDRALENYHQALPIFEEVGDRAGMAATLKNIGAVYRDIGQLDRVLEYYQQALPIIEEVGDRREETLIRWWIAVIYKDKGRLHDALAQLHPAVALADMTQSPNLKSITQLRDKVVAELESQGKR